MMMSGLKLSAYGEWLLSKLPAGSDPIAYDGPSVQYDSDGVMAASLIPFGQLAYVVHFSDDPDHVYFAPIGSLLANLNADDLRTAAVSFAQGKRR
jgi:hypothetical protein